MKKLYERISGVPARKGSVIVKSDGEGGTTTIRNTNAADRQGGASIEDLRKGRGDDKKTRRAKKLLKAGKITKDQYDQMVSEGVVSSVLNRINGRRKSTKNKLLRHGRKMHGRAMTLMGSSRTYDNGRNLYWKAAAEGSGLNGLSNKSRFMKGKKKFSNQPAFSEEHLDEGKKTDFMKKVAKRYGKAIVDGAKFGHFSHGIENDQLGDIIPAPTRYAKNIATEVGVNVQDKMKSHHDTYKNVKAAKKRGFVKEGFLEKLFGKDIKDIKKKDKAKSHEAKEADKKEKRSAANYERSGHGGADYDVEKGSINVGLPDSPTKKQTKDYGFVKKNNDYLSGASKVDPLAGARTKKTPAIKNSLSQKNIERMNLADSSQAPPGMSQKNPRIYKPEKKGEKKVSKNDSIPEFKEAVEYIENLMSEGFSEEEIINLLETPELAKIKKLIADYDKPDAKRYWDNKKVAATWRKSGQKDWNTSGRYFTSRKDIPPGKDGPISRNNEQLARQDKNIKPAFDEFKSKLKNARKKAGLKEGAGPWTGKTGKKDSKNLLGSRTVENGGKSGKEALDSVLKKMNDHYKSKKSVKEEIMNEAKIKLTPGKKLSKKEFAAMKAAALAPKPKKEAKPVAKKAVEEKSDLDLITQHPASKQIRSSLASIPVPMHREVAQKYIVSAIKADQGNKVHGFVKDPHGTLKGLLEKKPKSRISLAGPDWSKG